MKILCLAMMSFFFVSKNDPITGRWESQPSAKGNVTGVVFKNDSVLEAYVNRKPFATGTYRFNEADSMLSFTDNGCGGAEGVYKILFFSNSDSMRFKVVSDTCTERSNGMQRLVMGRVKKAEPK
jgi:hypothetical protein